MTTQIQHLNYVRYTSQMTGYTSMLVSTNLQLFKI